MLSENLMKPLEFTDEVSGHVGYLTPRVRVRVRFTFGL